METYGAFGKPFTHFINSVAKHAVANNFAQTLNEFKNIMIQNIACTLAKYNARVNIQGAHVSMAKGNFASSDRSNRALPLLLGQ